jgi:hypothetical protein
MLVMKNFRILFAVVFAQLAILPAHNRQSVTGTVSGTVVDASGGAIVDAAVGLTHDLSGQTRTVFTTCA